MTTFLIIIGFAVLLTSAYAVLQGAPFVPTRKKDVQRFLRMADIKPGQKMYDLGCGDGRLICIAASAGANAEGLEISLFPFILAHIRKIFSKHGANVKITYKNVWNTNLNDANLIYVWLMPKVMPRLKTKFEKELRKGTKVITYVWPIEGWQPIKVDKIEGRSKFYLYQI